MKSSPAVAATDAPKPIAKKRRAKPKKWNAPVAGYLFISPWLLGFIGLTAYPLFCRCITRLPTIP